MKFSIPAFLLAMSVTSNTAQAAMRISPCKYPSQCTPGGLRQLLESLAPSDDTLETCAQEEYALYLESMETHLGALAKPILAMDCPTLVFYSVETEEEGDSFKTVKEYDDDEEQKRVAAGSFPLERIVQAYNAVPAGRHYHFLIDMAEELDIDPNDPRFVDFADAFYNALYDGVENDAKMNKHTHMEGTEENMLLFTDESGAKTPATFIVSATLVTAAGAFFMMI